MSRALWAQNALGERAYEDFRLDSLFCNSLMSGEVRQYVVRVVAVSSGICHSLQKMFGSDNPARRQLAW